MLHWSATRFSFYRGASMQGNHKFCSHSSFSKARGVCSTGTSKRRTTNTQAKARGSTRHRGTRRVSVVESAEQGAFVLDRKRLTDLFDRFGAPEAGREFVLRGAGNRRMSFPGGVATVARFLVTMASMSRPLPKNCGRRIRWVRCWRLIQHGSSHCVADRVVAPEVAHWRC